jgi:hypothetical protein
MKKTIGARCTNRQSKAKTDLPAYLSDQGRQQQICWVITNRLFVYFNPLIQSGKSTAVLSSVQPEQYQPQTTKLKPALTIITGGVFDAETTSTPETIFYEIDEGADFSTPETVWAETAKNRKEPGARYVPTSVEGVVRILSLRPIPLKTDRHKGPEQ